MSKVYTKDHIDNRTGKIISDLYKQAKEQRTKQSGWQGYLSLPVLAADPSVTKAGQFGLYYNSATGKVRKSYNGGSWADAF